MWRNWFIGVLGIWMVVLAFLGFPQSVQRVLLVITGIVVAFISFWRGIRESVAESAEKLDSFSGGEEAPRDEKIS